MARQFTAPITYFLQEGKENMDPCLRAAFEAAKRHSITKLVIFTAKGDGARVALENFCSLEEYTGIQIIAVTFPQGKEFTDEDKNPIDLKISDENEALFRSHGVPVVRAHLPFDSIIPVPWERGTLGQDLTLVGCALNMFGGSMSLCIQATVLACDAGLIALGEHVIALTSDTAILVQAASTRRMLSELIVREILCKPVILTIGRGEAAEDLLEEPAEQELPSGERKALNSSNSETES